MKATKKAEKGHCPYLSVQEVFQLSSGEGGL